MVGLCDSAKAMLKHRCAEADSLNAKRLTPLCGYASFRAVFDLSGTDDAMASPYSSQAKSASKIDIILLGLFEIQDTSDRFFNRRQQPQLRLSK
jgi:hypothetical protein